MIRKEWLSKLCDFLEVLNEDAKEDDETELCYMLACTVRDNTKLLVD